MSRCECGKIVVQAGLCIDCLDEGVERGISLCRSGGTCDKNDVDFEWAAFYLDLNEDFIDIERELDEDEEFCDDMEWIDEISPHLIPTDVDFDDYDREWEMETYPRPCDSLHDLVQEMNEEDAKK